MTAKKTAEKVQTVVEETEQSEPTFRKEQLLTSEKYANRRDLVDALLEYGKKYTMKDVDRLIDDYGKGEVN
jgi:arginine repressor